MSVIIFFVACFSLAFLISIAGFLLFVAFSGVIHEWLRKKMQ